MVDYIRHKRRFSVVGACEGAIAGLVGITPAAGYVSVWLAAVIGFLTAVVCSLMSDINIWLHIDEGMDVFKLHGIGGMCGSFFTGIFATSSGSSILVFIPAGTLGAVILILRSLVSALDGVTLASGGLDGNGIQVGKQFAEICAISAYSFVVSFALLMIMKYIPGLHLRVSDEAEERGLDLDQFFDEQIGDWSYLDMVQKQQSPTIIGEAARGSDSSSTREGVTEERQGVTGEKAA